MKIVFFGTPDFVVPIVDILHKTYRNPRDKSGVIAVVTQPPKPVGRKQELEYSAVDKWAYDKNVKRVFDYDEIPDADIAIVAAYGRIIPEDVIDKFPDGVLNIHPSLLPKYRGASPIQAAIAAGETETGVTVIKMDEKMDHGPIISSFKEDIKPDDTNETLRKRLFDRSAQFLIDLLPNYLNGKIKLKEQNHELATFTKLTKKEDGFVANLFEDLQKTYNLYRAYQPWPGIYTLVKINNEQKRLKILKLHLDNKKLVLDKVQLEGKNAVSFEELKRGYPSVKISYD